MFCSSIILRIWCCYSSPCTIRPQPTTSRNSWLCFKVPHFTCVGNCTSYADFTDMWPSETFLLLLYHKLQPPGPPPCQRTTNQTKELSDLPALEGQFTQPGDFTHKYLHLQAHGHVMRPCLNPGIVPEPT